MTKPIIDVEAEILRRYPPLRSIPITVDPAEVAAIQEAFDKEFPLLSAYFNQQKETQDVPTEESPVPERP